jgi:serine/threonine protein phosphatase 1
VPPTLVPYPIFAVADLHGRLRWLDKLLAKLRAHPLWPAARVVFLGDLVDRGDDVKGLVARVMEVLAEKPGSACVMGNHDRALVGAAGLGDGGPRPYWVKRYGQAYDHAETFRSYLGRTPEYHSFAEWEADLAALRAAVPDDHRAFLAGLPWVAEAEGHVFLHGGLSPELDCPAETQLHCLRNRVWDRAVVGPRLGTATDREFKPDYPVWLGADKRLSADPLPLPGRVQVTGHVFVEKPDATAVRIRLDTSGGVREPVTACLLRGPGAKPEYVYSDG